MVRPPDNEERPMKSIGSLAAAVLFLIAGVTSARTAGPGIYGGQENQMDRFQQGVQSGALTKHEARKFRAQERALKADGTFDKTERKVVKRDLNRARRDIYRQKHDAQKRPLQPAGASTI